MYIYVHVHHLSPCVLPFAWPRCASNASWQLNFVFLPEILHICFSNVDGHTVFLQNSDILYLFESIIPILLMSLLALAVSLDYSV